jgi:hypothetical protein
MMMAGGRLSNAIGSVEFLVHSNLAISSSIAAPRHL